MVSSSASLPLVVLLGVLIALPPLGTDSWLPSLPVIAQDFGASVAEAQFTLTLYLVGMAAGQLMWGPLSDRYGRKPVLLAGLTIFCGASLAGSAAATVAQISAARLVQGFGMSCGPVIARSVVRDLHSHEQAARTLARMMVVFSVIPIAAPLAGAQLLVWRGWPAVFWLAAAAALALFAAVAAGLRETAPAARRSIHPAHLARGFGAMLAERRFLVPFLVMVCAQFGIVCYVSNSSFTLVRGFGVSPREYSFLFALSASGQIAGAWLASRAVPRHGLARTLRFGTAVAFASGALGAALAWAGATHWSSVVLPFLAFLFATTFIIPNATAAALTPFPHSAGSASSLMGAIAFAVGAAASAALGALFDGTARPMASAVALAGAGAFFIERRFFRGAA